MLGLAVPCHPRGTAREDVRGRFRNWIQPDHKTGKAISERGHPMSEPVWASCCVLNKIGRTEGQIIVRVLPTEAGWKHRTSPRGEEQLFQTVYHRVK